jgi:hypothetical protein
VRQALKAKATANRRSLTAEVLNVLEREAEEAPALKGAEVARRMRAAWKLMTPKEHREFGEDIERGLELMRRRERPPEP